MRRLGALSTLADVAGGVQRGGTARAAPDETRKEPAKEEAMRPTTRDAVLLMMPALFVLGVLAFGAMLALEYGLFAPTEEMMITPEVLAAYLDELVDGPLEPFEYSVEGIYPGHPDPVPTVGTSTFP